MQEKMEPFEKKQEESGLKEMEKIREAALRILDHSDNTSAELTRKLLKKGYGRETVMSVVESLRRVDLLNDERFAASYVRIKTEAGKGPVWIRQKLAEKGIPAFILDRALLEAEDRENERRSCLLRALELCGLKYDFELDREGNLFPAEGSPYMSEKASVFSGQITEEESVDRTELYRKREKEKARLARRLSSAGFTAETVRTTVGIIADL